jgi:hypothetical protein
MGGRVLQLETKRHEIPASPVARVVVLLAGVLGALLAQFVLDGLADSSDTWHEFQHGLLFFSGLAVAWSLTSLYSIAQGRTRR